MEKSENIESQKEFLLKMLELIPDLESNAEEISTYSSIETCSTCLTYTLYI